MGEGHPEKMPETPPERSNDASGEAVAPEAVERLVERLIESGATPSEIASRVSSLEPADVADTLEEMEPQESAEVLHAMEDEAAADALAHMELPLATTVVMDLDPGEAARLLELMEPDDAADILQTLSRALAAEILARMKPRQAARLGKLALYDPRTAGGMMTTDILVVRESMTIGQAIEHIKNHTFEESQSDIYVVDADRRLVGTVSMRDLLVHDDAGLVTRYIERELDVLTPEIDREEVADLFQKYDYITLPVVDQDRRILGMVTIDDVLDIIESERSEDPGKLVGVSAGEAVYSGVATKMKGRSPWLLLNLLLAQAGAVVLLIYHQFIEMIPIMAAVFPVIANQSGNSGHQSLAVTLRGLVLDQVRADRVARLLAREALTGLLTGLLVGGAFAVGIALLHFIVPEMTWRLGLVAGVAMAIAMPAACLIGAAIPILLDRFGLDPATASSILLTMLTDFLAYGIFLTLAFAARVWLGGG